MQQNKLVINDKKSNGRLIDLTGQKFNMLTVVEYAGSCKKILGWNDGGAAWLCRCDCGNKTIALGTRLRKGIKKSCGCTQKKQKGEGSFNAMYSVRKKAAKRRGLVWSLTKKEVKIISKQNCFYCGREPSNTSNGSANGEYIYSGIDRIDSSIGYIKSNVVPCCADCNYAKRDKTVKEFFEWIERVYKNHAN